MKYKLNFTKKADKSLNSFSLSEKNKIISSLKNLVRFYSGIENATQPDIKKIKGKYRGLVRLRSGKFRVILRIENDKLVILVIDVDKRKDIYKK